MDRYCQIFVPYSLLQNLLNVDTKCDTNEVCFVGVDVLGDPQNVELLPHGMVADKFMKQMNSFYDNLTVDQYVIMPNHIHLILFVHEDGSPRTSTPTKQTSRVSHFVSTFKRFCNKEYGEIYGNEDFTITLSEDERITKPDRITFTKIRYDGTTTNYMQRNRGMGFALCLHRLRCLILNAKLAIKRNDK